MSNLIIRRLILCISFSLLATMIIVVPAHAQTGFVVGAYSGTVDSPEGIRLNIEKIDGKKFSGVIQFFVGDRACRNSVPIVGVVADDGVIQIDATKDVTLGCERIFVLKVVDSELRGKLKGPRGEFDVRFVRKD